MFIVHHAYKVPIRLSHHKSAITLFGSQKFTITNDVFEDMASRPIASPSSIIPFHEIRLREIVP
jgi:hypothetical protein